MKILYFSPDMQNYQGALYQADVMSELIRLSRDGVQVEFYGPGFSGFDPSLNLSQVLDLFAHRSFKPDVLMTGHAWLSDHPKQNLETQPQIDFSTSRIPKVGILNKEYVRLSEKLNYFKERKFNLVFSHHHDVIRYQTATGIPFVFWPFGVNAALFSDTSTPSSRNWDFSFSGLVLNDHHHNTATADLRLKIQKKIFVSLGSIPFKKRTPYEKLKIFWNALSTQRLMRWVARNVPRDQGLHAQFLTIEKYRQLQQDSKIFLNALSPADLVSTRFFENLASRSLAFCQESKRFSAIVPANCFVSFKADLSDFDEKLFYYLSDQTAREEITERAQKEVLAHHTWEQRIQTLLQRIQSL